ncbi:unnamed protein product [Hydatigera taeniaeformis]|uniref:F-box domain-containing protein n=1 Tax=Hydatigena taeniaeformis TaxID=6205 RepID=A0A0R3WSD4_HYDTA|nr:unnamed protein product [Hydatigera taeniaeformis]
MGPMAENRLLRGHPVGGYSSPFIYCLELTVILYLIAADESVSDKICGNEKGKSSTVKEISVQPSQKMEEGVNHVSAVVSTSATPATSSPSTMRLSSSCPLTEKMSWAISDRSLQDIPRRAYARHTLLHSEAVVQVDYWLEQRCPLAYLGCPFSVVRLRPNSPAANLAYMPTVNAFTVRYTSANTSDSSTSLSATSKMTSTYPLDTTSTSSTAIHANSGIASVGLSPTTVATVCRLEQLPLQVLKRIINMLDEVSHSGF